MKHLLLTIATLLPSSLIAGSLVQITEDDGISGSSPTFTLESTDADTRLSAGDVGQGLLGQAPETSLTGTSNSDGLHGEGLAEDLHGEGQGDGLVGFVAPPPPSPEPEPEPIRFELHDLQFEYDSAVLAQTETSVIAELAAVIDRVAPRNITLVGHTDRRGSAEYNLDLSERRAIAVRDALVEWHGLDPSLFSVVGRGEQNLISAGISEADHARDRRVVVILTE